MRHRNFTPNCPKPPKIPRRAKVWDFRNIWRVTAHLRLYDFFTRWRWWVWADGSSAEWALLGGRFMDDVRSQSDITSLEGRIRTALKGDAITLCPTMSEGETMTFERCGSALIHSDPKWTNVLLSLGRFTVYWHATGRIGPKTRKADGFEANYVCNVKWFLYDYYDFPGWVLAGSIPEVLGLGHEYHVYSRWDARVQGTVRCGTSLTTGSSGDSGTEATTQYAISGSITIDNDCDGELSSIPDQIKVRTRLNGTSGGQDGEVTVGLIPDPQDPNNPRRIGFYAIQVPWDAAKGNPVDWNTPVAVRMDGSTICGDISCDSGQCLNMVTRTRTQPFTQPISNYDLRVFCSCIGG